MFLLLNVVWMLGECIRENIVVNAFPCIMFEDPYALTQTSFHNNDDSY